MSVPKQRWMITGGFIVIQILIWIVALQIFWYGNRGITDTPIYYDYASRMVNGMMPYRDFSSEYPPVAMLLFSLPRFLSGPSYFAFVVWFEAEMLAFSCGIVLLLSNLAWRQWRDINMMTGTLALYSFFLLALGSIVKLRFDLAVGFLFLAALFCFVTDRRLFAWLLLGVGVMTKIVPVLIAPLFLIAHLRRRQYHEMWMGPLAALLAALIIAIPFMVVAPAGLAGAFLYHVERPLQLESSWATPLLLMKTFGGFDLHIMNSYGSHNVFSAGAGLMAAISAPVTMGLLLVAYIVFYRNTAVEMTQREWQLQLTRFVTLTIAIFIVGGKVLSPQYFIWLLPLAPLIGGRDRRLVLGLFTAVLLITQWEFPARYWNLYMLQTDMVITVGVRNLLLAVFVAAVLLGGRTRQVPEADASLAVAPAESADTPAA
ncbi:MAG: hypothetical protein ACYCXF_01595 [Thermoleophilia bacterium]